MQIKKMNSVTICWICLVLLFVTLPSSQQVSKPSQSSIARIPRCVSWSLYISQRTRLATCNAKSRALENILNKSGVVSVRSVPPKTEKVSRRTFNNIKNSVLRTISRSNFKKASARAFLSAAPIVHRVDRSTTPIVRPVGCPADHIVKQSLTDLPLGATVTYNGFKSESAGNGGVLNMCNECHYNIKLPNSYRPNFISHVHCSQNGCLKSSRGELGLCVGKEVAIRVFEDNGGQNWTEHVIRVNIACCCQLKSIYATFFGY